MFSFVDIYICSGVLVLLVYQEPLEKVSNYLFESLTYLQELFVIGLIRICQREKAARRYDLRMRTQSIYY